MRSYDSVKISLSFRARGAYRPTLSLRTAIAFRISVRASAIGTFLLPGAALIRQDKGQVRQREAQRLSESNDSLHRRSLRRLLPSVWGKPAAKRGRKASGLGFRCVSGDSGFSGQCAAVAPFAAPQLSAACDRWMDVGPLNMETRVHILINGASHARLLFFPDLRASRSAADLVRRDGSNRLPRHIGHSASGDGIAGTNRHACRVDRVERCRQ